jgi:hypothetical protein
MFIIFLFFVHFMQLHSLLLILNFYSRVHFKWLFIIITKYLIILNMIIFVYFSWIFYPKTPEFMLYVDFVQFNFIILILRIKF